MAGISTEIHISFWMKSGTPSNNYTGIIERYINPLGGASGFKVYNGYSPSYLTRMLISSSVGAAAGANITSNANNGNWNKIDAIYDGRYIKMYFNGVLEGTTDASLTLGAQANSLYIGADSFDLINRLYKNSLDEIKISDTARSLGWIKTEYNNQNSPATFYTVT